MAKKDKAEVKKAFTFGPVEIAKMGDRYIITIPTRVIDNDLAKPFFNMPIYVTLTEPTTDHQNLG